MPMHGYRYVCDLEKLLWFTVPQSQCALMSQGSVAVE